MSTDRMQAHRLFFAKLVTANAGIAPGSELEAALASTPREQFVGPPPWRIFTRSGYVESPADDPALLYQDVVVSLGGEGPFNNGQPTLHALCLAALDLKKGERVVHVGAGTGYYTTLLAKLAGEEQPCRVSLGHGACEVRSGRSASRVRCCLCECRGD